MLTLPSPQGGAVLNGPALIAESQREMELLENQLAIKRLKNLLCLLLTNG